MSPPLDRPLWDHPKAGLPNNDSTTQVVCNHNERLALGAANQPAYGNTNGATAVTVVAAPTASTYRVVYMATCVNTTGGAVDIKWRVNNNGTTYIVGQALGVAAGGEDMRTWQGGLVLLPNQSLQLLLGGAGVIPWSAHWADPPM